jgi:hypothetical protein
MRKESGASVVTIGRWQRSDPKKRASWALEQGAIVAGYDIWTGGICLWWCTPKREQPRCGARFRDGNLCEAPPVWDRRRDRPVNGRCRMHGGLSTGPKSEQGRRRIAESNRSRDTTNRPSGEKRGKRGRVTQPGGMS